MNDVETVMRLAFLGHLTEPLEKTTLGAAFKALLEYHRDQKYDWALADDLMFSVDVERSDPERATGLMGLFGMTKPGEPIAIIVALERALDSVSNDETEIENEREEQFESILLELEYDHLDFSGFESTYEDSTDYETLEEFVQAVLENPAFKRLALLPAQRIEFVTDNEIV